MREALLSLFSASGLSELCPLQAQTTSSTVEQQGTPGTHKESLCEVAYKEIQCKV